MQSLLLTGAVRFALNVVSELLVVMVSVFTVCMWVSAEVRQLCRVLQWPVPFMFLLGQPYPLGVVVAVSALSAFL